MVELFFHNSLCLVLSSDGLFNGCLSEMFLETIVSLAVDLNTPLVSPTLTESNYLPRSQQCEILGAMALADRAAV
jgi:hypothetical protein